MRQALKLVGVAEIAVLLGVSRQRVHQIAHEDTTFPAPIAQLKAGQIWLRQDIEAWQRARRRRRDRPSRR